MSLAIAYGVKRKAKKMAKGGESSQAGKKAAYHSGYGLKDMKSEGVNHQTAKGVPGVSGMGMRVRVGDPDAKKMAKNKLEELRAMPKANIKGMAEGGEALNEEMIERLMRKRENCYSEGGQVANNTHQFEYEFEEPNNFDDLSRRDDLEFSYTGANSGDELGNDQLEDDESDMISRIMRSRAKKDRNPRPA